jgi:hypothetical protein
MMVVRSTMVVVCLRSMMVCSRPVSRDGRWWRSRGTRKAEVVEGAASEVDDDRLEVEDGGGVLRVEDEAVACSETEDGPAVCSRVVIEDGRWWQYNGV